MRTLAVLTLLTVLVAGCSGDDPDEGSPAPAVSQSSSTAPPPPPLPTSDTLHFLAAPDMAPALPPGGSATATPVSVGNFGQGGQGPDAQGAEWRHVVEGTTNVSGGEVRIWIVIKETLLVAPDNELRPTCAWSLTVELGADVSAIEVCLQEPPGPINPGTKELVFPLPIASPILLETNETITVRLERDGFSLSPNNAVDALSGSAEHDSRIKLAGLREPVRPA